MFHKLLSLSFSILLMLAVTGCTEDSGGGPGDGNGNNPTPGTGHSVSISNPLVVIGEGYHPKWSPDGSKLVYTIWHTSSSQASLHIYDIAADSSYTIVSRRSGDLSPEWSPDGKKVIFDAYDGTGTSQLYEWTMETNSIAKITSFSSHAFTPSYSNSGNQIAFAHRGAIYIRTISTGTDVIVPGTEHSFSPDWAVHDQQIVYACDPLANNMSDIYIIGIDGSSKVQITAYSGRDSRPRLSADGSFLIYEYAIDNKVHPVFYFFDTQSHYVYDSLPDVNQPDVSADLQKLTYSGNNGIVIADITVN